MKSKYALVTGGSSGIGLALAEELAIRSYSLLIVSNLQDQLDSIESKFTDYKDVSIKTLNLDLSEVDSAISLFEYCKKENLEIDVLINNAGFYFFGEAVDVDQCNASKMILLHNHTMAMLSTLFGKLMKEKGSGYILNISSISAYRSFPGIAHYGSTKAFIRSFTRSLRIELKPYNVRVTCAIPGATLTNLYAQNGEAINKAKKLGLTMTASRVAQIVIQALFKNKAEITPGFINKFFGFIMRHTPYAVISFIQANSKIVK